MSDALEFLDYLREFRAGEGRGNEELVRAMVPLMRQVLAAHDAGKVAPLDGTSQIHVSDGQLWFREAAALAPKSEQRAVRSLQKPESRGVEVGAHGTASVDLDTGMSGLRMGVQKSDEQILRPVYRPNYTSWEQETGHHDALTDVFALGMLFGSLATGLDFTEVEELERFVDARHRLTILNDKLHPVLARAMVRMTEVDRHKRAQDLDSLIARVASYRDVDERADMALDFESVEGFLRADRSSRRRIIQSALQSRLFDITRRNRLIWFKPTRAMLDLTIASVPAQLQVEAIRPEELFLWDGPGGRDVAAGRPVRLDKYLRLEEAPWIRGTLEKVRSEARRSRTEVGFSQLRLVVAFLNWHNLRDDADERIQSPLLLLQVTLGKSRGVRDSYVLQAQTEIAEVNPVLRHHLEDVYGLQLPDQVDLGQTDVETFQKVLAAEIARSEPGVSLHLLKRPQIHIVREKARRQLDAWRRRGGATGRGLRTELGVEYSYSRTNYNPLGLQIYLQKVKAEELALEEHLETAKPIITEVAGPDGKRSAETGRDVYTVAEHAAGPYDWAVDLTHCTLGNFNYRKMSLVRDYGMMLDEADGQEHPSFDRLFSLDARELDDSLTSESDPLGPVLVVPADPTQTEAVATAQSGQSFIIQGPPGTGKSQTITNLIADFVARGRRVLFVCQKRAALDVVYHRLSQHGLDQLSVLIHDAQSDKKQFIDDLKTTYQQWAGEALASDESADETRDEVTRRMQTTIDSLTRFCTSMRGPVEGGSESVVAVLAERLATDAPPELSAAESEFVPDHGAWKTHRAAVHNAAKALQDVGESPIFSELALRQVGGAILEAQRPLAALLEGLDRLDALLEQVHSAASAVRADASTEDLAQAVALARRLRSLLPDQLELLEPGSNLSAALASFERKLKTAQRDLAAAEEKATGWHERLPPADARSALEQARGLASGLALLRLLSPTWWRLRASLRASYNFAARRVRPTWASILAKLVAVYDSDDTVQAIEQGARDSIGFEGPLAEFRERIDGLRSKDGLTPLELELRGRWIETPGAVDEILAAQGPIEALQAEAARVFDGGDTLSFAALAPLVDETRAASDLLPEVQDSLRQLLAASPDVRQAVRSLPLTPGDWDRAVSQLALDRTFRANRPLARFTHATLRQRQAELERDYKALLAVNAHTVRERVRERFQARLALCSLPTAQLTDEQKATKRVYNAGRRVLDREFEKMMRHRSIRDLSGGDSGTVVYDLKPIWLMSPLSISETVPIDEQRFDVVIFDEASQIPVEEAVPAVYRAPQMIVVGDQMQLPPTDFFSASRATSDDPEEDELFKEVQYDLEAESFLSHAASKLASTMLGWHYRSRHEALIRFSNQAFYEGRLRTIPDRLRQARREPIAVDEPESGDLRAAQVLDRPISYHRLANSPYERRTNTGEATYIARLVRGLLRSDAGQTIGIVAFSEAQQGEIESALQRLGGEDPRFRRELEAEYEREDEGHHVGLFVKNLENVQGDERDIVILSVCYGPDPSGKMRMNFGPINKGGGEKRLNVVFSRAKHHMVVVSSIDYLVITNEFNDGAMCLRRYLQFAAAASMGDDESAALVMGALDRRLGRSPRGAESGALVSDVAASIRARGLIVAENQGASGFRVDLAVACPDAKNWTVAVSIDTPASYDEVGVLEQHHVRPSVLRAFGWAVVPILGKDWLVDPEGCLQRVERALASPDTVHEAEAAEALDGKDTELVAGLVPTDGGVAERGAEQAAGETAEDVGVATEEGGLRATSDAVVTTDSAADATPTGDSGIRGQTIVFTGRLTELTRASAASLVKEAGGCVGTKVTASTDVLVVGERPGSKLQAAERQGVRVVGESTFLSWFPAAPDAS